MGSWSFFIDTVFLNEKIKCFWYITNIGLSQDERTNGSPGRFICLFWVPYDIYYESVG